MNYIQRFRAKAQYNPFHPHCGPFNKVNDYPSDDPIDEACRIHDIQYEQLSEIYGEKDTYLWFNEADEILLSKLPAMHPYAIYFRGKQLESAGRNYHKLLRDDEPKGNMYQSYNNSLPALEYAPDLPMNALVPMDNQRDMLAPIHYNPPKRVKYEARPAFARQQPYGNGNRHKRYYTAVRGRKRYRKSFRKYGISKKNKRKPKAKAKTTYF